MFLDLQYSHISLHFLLSNSLWHVPMFFRMETTAVLSICIFIVKFEKYVAKHFKEKYAANFALTFI